MGCVMRAIMILIISLLLVLPTAALAAVVGHLTQVEGRVELLKGGKLPVTAAKVQDGVEPGDVLRTKSLSRAQITFMDNTSLTLSPESRIAIEEYAFDPAKGKRSAVLQLFQGLAHFVVTQVFKVQEPDFLVKTHTGVLGVRGTDFGIRLSPNDSTFLNFQGLVRVGNIFPEVGGTFKKADKIAFSFGGATVDLKDMQGSTVARDLPPTLVFTITEEDRQMFMRQLHDGLKSTSSGDSFPGGSSDLAANLPDAVSPAVTNRVATLFNNIYIPPTPDGSTSGYLCESARPIVFTDLYLLPKFYRRISWFQRSFTLTNRPSAAVCPLAEPWFIQEVISPIISGLTGVTQPGAFIWPSTGGGTFTVTSNSVTVSGLAGGTFTGTMQMVGTMAGFPTTTLTLSGPVTIDPSGTLTFTTGGTLTATIGGTVPITIPGTVTGGTMNSRSYRHDRGEPNRERHRSHFERDQGNLERDQAKLDGDQARAPRQIIVACSLGGCRAGRGWPSPLGLIACRLGRPGSVVIDETAAAWICFGHAVLPPPAGLICDNGTATLEKRATTSARKRVLFCQLINPNPIVKP